jgi:hypothetical protein
MPNCIFHHKSFEIFVPEDGVAEWDAVAVGKKVL